MASNGINDDITRGTPHLEGRGKLFTFYTAVVGQ